MSAIVERLQWERMGILCSLRSLAGGNIGTRTVVHSRQIKKRTLEIQEDDENCNGVESISGEHRH